MAQETFDRLMLVCPLFRHGMPLLRHSTGLSDDTHIKPNNRTWPLGKHVGVANCVVQGNCCYSCWDQPRTQGLVRRLA